MLQKTTLLTLSIGSASLAMEGAPKKTQLYSSQIAEILRQLPLEQAEKLTSVNRRFQKAVYQSLPLREEDHQYIQSYPSSLNEAILMISIKCGNLLKSPAIKRLFIRGPSMRIRPPGHQDSMLQ
jgi:hypothetical protein